MATYQDYKNTLLNGTYKQKIKIQLLRGDETPMEEITVLLINTSGNLSVQRSNGIRRTVNFDIINLDNKYIPNPDSLFVRQKLQMWLGLEMPDGSDYWIPQGVFILNDPSTVSNFSESLIKIQGTDKFSLMDGSLGGELGYVYQIPSGKDVSQAIRDVLILSGDPKLPIIDVALIGLTVPHNMIYQPTDTLGKIIIDLSQLYSASCFYNEIGKLIISVDADDNIKSSIWDFSPDQFAYQGATNQYKWSQLFNSVRVTSSNVNSSSVSYKSSNTNLLSPTSIPNLGFERIFYYASDKLSTLQQCNDLANYILKRKTSVQNAVQINSIPMYHLNPDDICTLTDPKLGLVKERFIINDFSLSLQVGGKLTVNCVKSMQIPFI